VRSDFECYWAPIDGQYELRSEASGPPGSANDDELARSLDEFRDWVSGTVLADRAPITTSAYLPVSRCVVGRCG
jgi:hypothetical protein